MKKINFLLCVSTLLAMASCNTSDDDNTLKMTFEYASKDCFTYMNNNGETSFREGASFGFMYDYGAHTMSMGVKGLNDGETQYPDFYLDNLKWSYDGAWKTTRQGNVNVRATGAMPEVTNVEIRMLDRMVNGFINPVYQINMSFDNGVSFAVYPKTMTYFGNTVVSAAGVEDFKTKESSYVVTLDPKKQNASLQVKNARFATNMPAGMNMTFNDIDFTATMQALNLTCDALIPEIGGDPYPSFAISQLNGRFGLSSGMMLNFHCAAMGRDYTVAAEGAVLIELLEN